MKKGITPKGKRIHRYDPERGRTLCGLTLPSQCMDFVDGRGCLNCQRVLEAQARKTKDHG